MDYGRILNRAVNIVWENKFLIVLGILAALGSGSFSGGGGGGGGGGGNGQAFGDPGQFSEFNAEIAGLAAGFIIAVFCVVLFVGLILFAISAIARGGLIAGVDAIESGEKTSFSPAWSAAWQRVWTLLGIGIVPGIPGILLFAVGLLALTAYGGMSAFLGERVSPSLGMGLGGMVALVACVILPIILALSILRTFAERAAMLEDLGVVDAYRRGFTVLSENIGEAIILFVLQIAITIVLAVVLFVPGIFLILCCILWPVLLVAQGAFTAFISAIWTLAWRTWTGATPPVEKGPKMA